jgi:hypothetical protein
VPAQVISITKQRDEHLVAMFEFWLDLAKRGELLGAGVFGQDVNGLHEMTVSGDYRRRPSKGAAAALRVASRLAEMDDSCQLVTPKPRKRRR